MESISVSGSGPPGRFPSGRQRGGVASRGPGAAPGPVRAGCYTRNTLKDGPLRRPRRPGMSSQSNKKRRAQYRDQPLNNRDCNFQDHRLSNHHLANNTNTSTARRKIVAVRVR